MVVHDLLYGRVEIPAIFDRLVMVPEVRRLSQVRLLNCLTPSLSSLGEVRRFSHTLGVLHLWGRLRRIRWSASEFNALGAAILLHDVGTPPFGHLFEYQLRELSGWSHEDVIHSVLWGHAAPEDKAHQIFAGRAARFRQELNRARISLDLVDLIITGKHPLSRALFGSLDLDNLDNVARMAAYLGWSGSASVACEVAEQLEILPDGRLSLQERTTRPLIARWQELRKAAYDILVFDSLTVAAQAILSDAIRSALESGDLSEDDWCLSDEDLLNRLASSQVSKKAITLEYLGQLPQLVCAIQISGELDDIGYKNPSRLRAVALETIREATGDSGARVYVFVDKGSFAKRLSFADPHGGDWCVGDESRSVVVHAFAGNRRLVPRQRRRVALELLLSRLGVSEHRLIRAHIDEAVADAEPTFHF